VDDQSAATPVGGEPPTDGGTPRRLSIKILEGAGHLPIHAQIKHSLSFAIGSGQLAPGAQLPSVRELAAELRLAANTVARAYQELQEEGVLVTQAGRGTFVRNLIDDEQPAASQGEALRRILQPAVASARAVGFSAEAIRDAVTQLLADAAIVVGLVCLNRSLCERWGQVLRSEYAELDLQVIGLTLEELERDLPRALELLAPARHVFSLLTTYPAVRSRLHPHQKKISALITELSLETHQALAELPAGEPVGLVCIDLYENSILSVITPYVAEEQVRRVSPDDEAALRGLLREVRVVLHTSTAARAVQSLSGPETRLIELQFVPNRASFEQIRSMLKRDHLRL
jgi:GntR family transcriptional regulator